MPIPPLSPVGVVPPGVEAPVASRGQSFGSLLAERMAHSPISTWPNDLASAARGVAKGMEQTRRRLDSMLAAAHAGRAFTPAELISLQTLAYRYSQSVELTARVFEQGTQTVKQVVNSPI